MNHENCVFAQYTPEISWHPISQQVIRGNLPSYACTCPLNHATITTNLATEKSSPLPWQTFTLISGFLYLFVFELEASTRWKQGVLRVFCSKISRLFLSWNDNFPDIIKTITLSHKVINGSK